MNVRLRSVLASVLAASAACAASADLVVELRGGSAPIVATGVAASPRGLEVRRAGAAAGAQAELVAWDLVRGVAGSPVPAELDANLAIAEDLWRARIRIERGDHELAEPVLRAHWERFRTIDGPTAALVKEGLMRCALAKGDLAAALDPWFALLAERASTSRFPSLAPLTDADTGLMPAVSPFAPARLREPMLEACRAAASDASRGAPSVVAGLERLIVASHADSAPAASAPAKEADTGVRALALLEAIAAAADARARERAVGDFDRAFAEPPPFLACWRLAAIGASSARAARASGDAAALERAAIDMLAVPASRLDRHGLADAFALEEAARLMRAAGDARAAARLEAARDERMRRAGIAPADGGSST